jgi:hypothetical protein
MQNAIRTRLAAATLGLSDDVTNRAA